MKKFISLSVLMLVCMAVSGQKIIKGTFFNAHALGVCNDTTGLTKIALDPTNATLNVYSWTGLFGSIDMKFDKSGDKEKSKKEKLGSLMKRAEALNKAQNDNERAPDIGCMVVRKLTFEDIMTSDPYDATTKGAKAFYAAKKSVPYDRMKHITIYPKKMRTDAVYSFDVSDYERCGGEQVNLNKIPMISADDLRATYPDLDLDKSYHSFGLVSKGEGLLGIKNMKTYFETVESAYEVDSVWCRIGLKVKKAQMPNFETNVGEMEGYDLHATRDKTLSLNESTKFAILRQSNKEEKFGMYTSFKLVKYNDQGELLQTSIVKPDYLKDISYFNFTYDKAGNPAGIALILSSFSLVGGKSLRDPKDNNHFLYYFGLDGKEQYHIAFEHGEGDNPRGLNPNLIKDENGALAIWNVNYEKLFKPKIEIVQVSKAGKTGMTPYEVTEKKGAIYKLNSDGLGSLVIPAGDGNLLLVSRSAAKPEPNTNKVSANGEGNVFMAIVSMDFKVLGSETITHYSFSLPQVDYLGTIGGAHKIVVSTASSNHFVSINEKASTALVFPNAETQGVYLSRDMIGKNYIYEKASNKIYAIYQHGTGNGLGYLLVVEP